VERAPRRKCADRATPHRALSDLLYLSLVEVKKIEEDLFEGTAPLASFSARIKLAFYLGLISAECRADLETIRRIRNDFAHKPDLISFDTQSIADRCRRLEFSYQLRESPPRAHFTAAVSGILAIIQGTALRSVAPKPKPDDRPSEKEKEAARQRAARSVEELEQYLRDLGTKRDG